MLRLQICNEEVHVHANPLKVHLCQLQTFLFTCFYTPKTFGPVGAVYIQEWIFGDVSRHANCLHVCWNGTNTNLNTRHSAKAHGDNLRRKIKDDPWMNGLKFSTHLRVSILSRISIVIKKIDKQKQGKANIHKKTRRECVARSTRSAYDNKSHQHLRSIHTIKSNSLGAGDNIKASFRSYQRSMSKVLLSASHK